MTVGFAKVSIKGEGDSAGCFVLLYAPPFTSGLRVKSAMTDATPCSTLWIPAYAGMTVRGWRGFTGLGRCCASLGGWGLDVGGEL